MASYNKQGFYFFVLIFALNLVFSRADEEVDRRERRGVKLLHIGPLHRRIVCEGSSMILSCPPEEVISVITGYYGRSNYKTCPHRSIRTTSCSANGSFQTLKSNCNGRNSCSVRASNSVFGDPCVGTYKYVEMTYVCKRGSEIHSITVCEGYSQAISCPTGKIISIRSGYYGRDDGLTCPHRSIRTTSCSANGSFQTLKSNCNGRNSCSVRASNSVFGDPCVGTYKYVEMTYLCKRGSESYTITVCEGYSQAISCPTGKIISIRSGYYGRDDGITCPHRSIRTTSCSAQGSFQTLKSNCNGRNSCIVLANNSVFGDPCVGTYKYVEMVYTCL